jgi:hypothetical protein
MNNIHLKILGSIPFLNLLDELQFNKILNISTLPNHNDKIIFVKILFAENLKIKELKNYLEQNEPIILFLKDINYIKKNNLNLLNFHITLELPIEIFSFKEILSILVTKYCFFKQSKIIINDYQIDSNERSIIKDKVKVKLTEKELNLILALNKSNGLNKSFLLKTIWKHSLDLDTHAFETQLHRLRKKIQKYFKDKNFITEKNSLYYLNN